MTPKDGDRIVVWFSNGAASAVAWHETLRRYGSRCIVTAVNNPVREEDDDNRRFAKDVERWVERELVFHTSPEWPEGSAEVLWEKERFMSGPWGASCTRGLKKEARYDYEKHNRVDWHVLGFTADEKKRHDRFVLGERSNVLPVLIDAGLTKQDCANRLMASGIELPRVYALGYPNANCVGCVKSASVTYWQLVRETHPDVFQRRAEQSRRLGVRLVIYKGARIFLDELPPDATGAKLKVTSVECGIFCEERPHFAPDIEALLG